VSKLKALLKCRLLGLLGGLDSVIGPCIYIFLLLLRRRSWRLRLGRGIGYVVEIDVVPGCIAVPAEYVVDSLL
jgi:hypothetical protein